MKFCPECGATLVTQKFCQECGANISKYTGGSFVMRDGHLYKISSGTFPIGILPQVSAENTDFSLCAGDVIILCSDGILSETDTCDGEDVARFLDMITREWTEDLESMADKILTYSSDFSVRTDDMSIAFLRIKQAK